MAIYRFVSDIVQTVIDKPFLSGIASRPADFGEPPGRILLPIVDRNITAFASQTNAGFFCGRSKGRRVQPERPVIS
jgi:hypothetical protein